MFFHGDGWWKIYILKLANIWEQVYEFCAPPTLEKRNVITPKMLYWNIVYHVTTQVVYTRIVVFYGILRGMKDQEWISDQETNGTIDPRNHQCIAVFPWIEVCIIFRGHRNLAIDEFQFVLCKESTLKRFSPRLVIATDERRGDKNSTRIFTRVKVIQRGNNGTRITIVRVLRSSRTRRISHGKREEEEEKRKKKKIMMNAEEQCSLIPYRGNYKYREKMNQHCIEWLQRGRITSIYTQQSVCEGEVSN